MDIIGISSTLVSSKYSGISFLIRHICSCVIVHCAIAHHRLLGDSSFIDAYNIRVAFIAI